MPQIVVYILLLFALVLPILGAAVLRVAAGRLTLNQLYGAGAAILGVALVSVFLLARSDVPQLQIGGVSILLPVAAPEDIDLPLPDVVADAPTAEQVAPAPAPAETPTALGTSAPAATAAPTDAPTATPEPTEVPTATPEPTAAPTTAPTAPPPPPEQRRYTVQPGDTLRSIAEEFDVSVSALIEANDLTPEQADSLRVGQELIIP